MKTILVVAVLFSSLLASSAFAPAYAEDTRATNPNAVSIEIFGKSFLYTLEYDRAFADNFFAGFGVGSVGMQFADGTDAGQTAHLIPVYAGYYFIKDEASPFVIAGASVETNGADVANLKTSIGGATLSSSQVLPFFGLGFEERTDNGFLFRVTAYGMCASTFKPWFGATFGYAF